MDTKLKERVDQLSRYLDGEDRIKVDKYMTRWIEKMSRASSRVNKYRYKTRTVRLDSAKFSVAPYERVLDTLGESYKGIDVFNRDEFHRALERMVQTTKTEAIFWDSQYVNPITILAHGLRIEFCDGSVVTLKCDSCKETLSLDLSDSEFNQQYASHLLTMHKSVCFWHTSSVPLDIVYYVNKSSVIYEIERIKIQWARYSGLSDRFKSWQLGFPLPEKIKLLCGWFGYQSLQSSDIALLYVLLRGYAPVDGQSETDFGILQCVGSYLTVDVKQVLCNSDFNGHPKWSSHYDQDTILDLLYDTLIEIPDESMQGRISRLKRIITKW